MLRLLNRTIVFLALVTFLGNDAVAQADTEVKTIILRTNWPAAMVEIDGVQQGPASLESFTVAGEASRLRLLPPSSGSWAVSPIETVLGGTAGDTLNIRLPFPYYYKFESAPHDASVLLSNSSSGTLLGTTPLLYATETPLVNDVEISFQGFISESIRPGDEIWNRYLVELTPVDASAIQGEVVWNERRQRRWWIDAAALTTAAAAGALAVHYKFKADNRFDEFQVTGDPDLRPRIERLDTYSAVSLGFMQAGIGVFAIRLVLR